jgi:hypothetical protein
LGSLGKYGKVDFYSYPSNRGVIYFLIFLLMIFICILNLAISITTVFALYNFKEWILEDFEITWHKINWLRKTIYLNKNKNLTNKK